MAERPRLNAIAPGMSAGATALMFLSLVALFLLPAWLNGFPWVMDDSIAYSGQGVNWMRAKTAAVLVAPLYGLIGYWALPVFNAVVNAAAWLLLIRNFDLRAYWLVLPLAVLALQPLYTSAVLVDAWFFAAVVFLIVSIRSKSPFLALSAGILFSGHASGLILACVLTVLVALFFGIRKAGVMPVLAIGTAIVVSSFLNAKYYPDTPSLSRTFLAARLFSVKPELLRLECERTSQKVLCEAADLIETIRHQPENAGRRDFFWDLMRAFPGRFELAAFERDHAWPIIRTAITTMPLETTTLMLQDFFSFYGTGTRLDFASRLNEPMPQPFAASWQAKGVWETDSHLAMLTGLRLLLYACFAVALITGWQRLDRDTRLWIAILLLVSLANDGLFAVVSGPPDRYHHRILPLLASATALLLVTNRRHHTDTSSTGK
ncbi:MAG: hypothetical protein O9309_15650 [Rhizobium sp.]|nr:hypothetical protein [Rhizobium sp.]MCZ8350940.1 hypothetical protein [Rhizobium sp.]